MAGAGELTLSGPGSPRLRPSSSAKGLEWCGLIAVLLHLAVLLWAAEQGGRPGPRGAPGEHRQVFQVRTIALSSSPQRARAAAVPHPLEVGPPGGGGEESARTRVPTFEGDPAAALASVGGDNGDDAYLPRSALSVPPHPMDAVDVPYPLVPGDRGHYVARLWLFIDEAGVVQRVTAEPGDVPDALTQAARHAFLSARFEPGQFEGRPVKSRIHVEVRFDSLPVQH